MRAQGVLTSGMIAGQAPIPAESGTRTPATAMLGHADDDPVRGKRPRVFTHWTAVALGTHMCLALMEGSSV